MSYGYGYGYSDGGTDKLDTKVNFPIRDLDLTHQVVGHNSEEPLKYDLFAVSNHYGGLGGGHYTAYGQNPISKKWAYFDDGWVKSADPEDSVNEAAYVLFYRRQGSPDMDNVDFEALKQVSQIEVPKQADRKSVV